MKLITTSYRSFSTSAGRWALSVPRFLEFHCIYVYHLSHWSTDISTYTSLLAILQRVLITGHFLGARGGGHFPSPSFGLGSTEHPWLHPIKLLLASQMPYTHTHVVFILPPSLLLGSSLCFTSCCGPGSSPLPLPNLIRAHGFKYHLFADDSYNPPPIPHPSIKLQTWHLNLAINGRCNNDNSYHLHSADSTPVSTLCKLTINPYPHFADEETKRGYRTFPRSLRKCWK